MTRMVRITEELVRKRSEHNEGTLKLFFCKTFEIIQN